ncbi:hypothetical protein D3C71_1385710 [compost metagenome]
MAGNSKRCGQPGRADAAGAEIAFFRHAVDAIVLFLRCRPQARIDGRDRRVFQRGHELDRLGDQHLEFRLRHFRPVALFLFFRRRADQKIAEDRAGQHHALGACRRHRQKDGPQMSRRRFVEDDELALARTDLERGCSEQHLLDAIPLDSGAVDDASCAQSAVRCLQVPELAVMTRRLQAGIEDETGTHHLRLRRIGERRRPRVDQDFTRHQNGGPDMGGKRRFAFERFVAAQKPRIGDAVFVCLGEQLGKACLFHLVPCGDHGAGVENRQVEALADLHVLVITRLHALQFDTARRRIEAGMKDGAIGF